LEESAVAPGEIPRSFATGPGSGRALLRLSAAEPIAQNPGRLVQLRVGPGSDKSEPIADAETEFLVNQRLGEGWQIVWNPVEPYSMFCT
jgi:hypothetical protein